MNDSTHSEDCWQWHHDCAVRRTEAVLALHAPVETDRGVVCNVCGSYAPCPTVRAVRGRH